MATNRLGTQKGFSQADQPGQPTSQEGLTSEARQGKANHWPIQPSLASKARPAGQPDRPASRASRSSQPDQPHKPRQPARQARPASQASPGVSGGIEWLGSRGHFGHSRERHVQCLADWARGPFLPLWMRRAVSCTSVSIRGIHSQTNLNLSGGFLYERWRCLKMPPMKMPQQYIQ